MYAHGCLRDREKGHFSQSFQQCIIHISISHLFVIPNHIRVCFVVLIIQILLVLRHASQLQSSDMFVAVFAVQ